MKKTKIIVPALGVLLLSTAASVTGTVAWFSMNNFVTATGMNVKAKAENGIVISNQSAASGEGVTWKETAASKRTGTLEVKPTSTATGATWVHSTSNDSADANTENDYELLTTAVDTTSGAGYADDNNHAGYDAADGDGYVADSVYYAMHSFYIKSSAEAIKKPLYITNVKVTLPTTQNSEDLNKALRVLVRLNSDARSVAYEEILKGIEKNTRLKQKKEDELEKLKRILVVTPHIHEEVIGRRMLKFRKGISNNSIDSLKTLLKMLIKEIRINNEEVRITINLNSYLPSNYETKLEMTIVELRKNIEDIEMQGNQALTWAMLNVLRPQTSL